MYCQKILEYLAGALRKIISVIYHIIIVGKIKGALDFTHFPQNGNNYFCTTPNTRTKRHFFKIRVSLIYKLHRRECNGFDPFTLTAYRSKAVSGVLTKAPTALVPRLNHPSHP
jgi:hypothetical protein